MEVLNKCCYWQSLIQMLIAAQVLTFEGIIENSQLVNAFHLVPGDNSRYVEGDSDYIWMPDGHGVPHLANVKAPVNEALLKYRSGANNEYLLYTRRNPYKAQVMVHGNANTIWNSNYISSQPLRIIVHGWNNNGNSPMNDLITSAFLSVHDDNVIVVDWRTLASSDYSTASEAVLTVGQYLGNFLMWLVETTGANWNQVHLVGFSLGAHIAGVAGRYVGGKPAQVTGLDPAGPQWGGNPNALNRNSGQYVECIHTDGGALGSFDHISHADFYPNGGRNPQPGCVVSTCSHGRSIDLFASSVRFNHLVGRLCSSIWEAQFSTCIGRPFRMGNSIISKKGNGLYGLLTKDTWPF